MEFLERLKEWIESSDIHHQIQDVDVAGLFSNPWFLVPFLAFVVYLLWQREFWSLLFVAMVIGFWMLCGTELMSGFVSGGELNQEKLLPVIWIAIGAAVVLVLFLFGRPN